MTDDTKPFGQQDGSSDSSDVLWRNVRIRAERARSAQLYLLPTITVTQSVPMWGTLLSAHVWFWSWGFGFSVYVKGAGWYPDAA